MDFGVTISNVFFLCVIRIPCGNGSLFLFFLPLVCILVEFRSFVLLLFFA